MKNRETIYSVLTIAGFIVAIYLLNTIAVVPEASTTKTVTKKTDYFPPVEKTEAELRATVAGDTRVTILKSSQYSLDLINSSGEDIKFKMLGQFNYVAFNSIEVEIPKDTKFTVYRRYNYNEEQKEREGWHDLSLTLKTVNGLYIQFRNGVDGPWDECSYMSDENKDNCIIEEFVVGGIYLHSVTSKESGELLDVWVDSSPSLPLPDIRIYTKDGRPLNDADKAVIEKVINGSKGSIGVL